MDQKEAERHMRNWILTCKKLVESYPNNQGARIIMEQNSNLTRSKELAEAHWEGYVKGLLEATGVDKTIIKVCAFVYVSTFIHGYKHAMQDVENTKKVFSEHNTPGTYHDED